MELEHYDLTASADSVEFDFVSVGPKGRIRKLIRYVKIGEPAVYNLGFGDFDPAINDFNDRVVTDNGDGEKVLATVAASVVWFLDHYPGSWIYFKGSTLARTRLYRMGLSRYHEELLEDVDLFGFTNDRWEDFTKNTPYESFLVRQKTLTSEL